LSQPWEGVCSKISLGLLGVRRFGAASGIIKSLALNNLKEMSVAAEPTNAGEELGGKTDLCLIQIRLAMPSLEKISLGCQGDSPQA
jgi:hypothetical protein